MEDLLTREKTDVKVPKKFNVVLINDDYTPMDFVVEILVKHFNKTVDEAIALTLEVHKSGKGIAGTYPRDIAETKAKTVEKIAQKEEYPFRLQVQEA